MSGVDPIEDVSNRREELVVKPNSKKKNSIRDILSKAKSNELRGGISINQPRFPLSSHPLTIQSLCKFQVYISQQSQSIQSFPVEYNGLIACLIQESELELENLATSVLDILCPSEFRNFDNEIIGVEVLKSTVTNIAGRINYGLQLEDINPKLYCWIWEIKDASLFPSQLIEKIILRRNDRQVASKCLLEYVNALPQEYKSILFNDQPPKDTIEIVSENPYNEELPLVSDIRIDNNKSTKRKSENEPGSVHKIIKKTKIPEFQKCISGFFRKVDKVHGAQNGTFCDTEKTNQSLFSPYQLKSNASLSPYTLSNKSVPSTSIDKILEDDVPISYLILDMKKRAHGSRTSENMEIDTPNYRNSLVEPLNKEPTYPYYKTDEIMNPLKWKLFQYHDSFRPAYWGTWTKASRLINGRKPLETDKLLLNYDIDSEEEWEVQDEMGEELNSEEDEFDNEGQSQSSTFDNESSDNNSWIVPNGYLSDYEGAESDNSEKNFEHIERSENKNAVRYQQNKHSYERRIPSKKVDRWCVTKVLVPKFTGFLYADVHMDVDKDENSFNIFSTNDKFASIGTLLKYKVIEFKPGGIQMEHIVPSNVSIEPTSNVLNRTSRGANTQKFERSKAIDEGALLKWFKQPNTVEIISEK